jgi:SNF2 family DNA or RNA helicase
LKTRSGTEICKKVCFIPVVLSIESRIRMGIKIIHGTWIPKSNTEFMNRSRFALWAEREFSSKAAKTAKHHPYSLGGNELESILCDDLGLFTHGNGIKGFTHTKCFFIMPTLGTVPVPSQQYWRESVLDSSQKIKLETWEIDCLYVEKIASFHKNISFWLNQLPPGVRFGYDLLFWQKHFLEFEEIIKKDQYIPAIKCRKNGEQNEYYPSWELLSPHYDEFIKNHAKKIPLSCTAGFEEIPKEKIFFDRQTLVQHAGENLLDQYIEPLTFTKKIISGVSNTFIEGCVDKWWVKRSSWSNTDWQAVFNQWLIWKEKVKATYASGKFYLCFRLEECANDSSRFNLSFLVQSKEDLSFQIPLSDYWNSSTKEQCVYQKLLGTGFEQELLIKLGYASRIYPHLMSGLSTTYPAGFYLSIEEAYSFLSDYAAILNDSGFKVFLPQFWLEREKRWPKIKTVAKSSNYSSAFSLSSLVQFDYQLVIGGEPVSEEEWSTLVNAKAPLVKFRGEWIELDKHNLSTMVDFWHANQDVSKKATILDLVKSYALEEQIEFDDQLSSFVSKLKNKNGFVLINEPEMFIGQLREYQKRGFSWLCFMQEIGMNPCLADDMGLGKTIQVLALLSKEKADGVKSPTLLVAPTSVLGNWARESKNFCPTLNCFIHHGSQRPNDLESFTKIYTENDLIITSFSLIRKDAKLFNSVDWQRIIIDEAQNIKNPSAQQTRAINAIKSRYRLVMTGTPVENRLLDLWSIFNFLNPGYLGTKTQFKQRFEKPIQGENDLETKITLKKIVEPFILRRSKNDKNIIKDLPDKIEQKIHCNLTKEQASLYDAIVRDVNEQIDSLEGIERQGLMLSTLMKLKQICNHPTQFLKDNSEFNEQRSHKLIRLKEMLEEVITNQESLLIFTQFTELGILLNRFLGKNFACDIHYLHGRTTRKKREAMIKEFQHGNDGPSIFILSLKAGGIGITLTKASHVFHFDRWWNPAVEDQATDRAYRIGQKKKVLVHKFITVGTLEEKIDQMIEKKRSLAESIVEADESWLTKLDNQAFKKLISLSKSAILE